MFNLKNFWSTWGNSIKYIGGTIAFGVAFKLVTDGAFGMGEEVERAKWEGKELTETIKDFVEED